MDINAESYIERKMKREDIDRNNDFRDTRREGE